VRSDGPSEWPSGAAALRLSLLLLLALGMVSRVLAGQWPAIRSIEFAGNGITRPQTMLREITVRVGDPADPARIERSRQAIQDLGLFRSVAAELQPLPGGVRLLFTVKEKWPLLPVPRVEGNGSGEYGYGAQLRWNNLWGLNHTLNLQAMRRRFRDPDKTANTQLQLGYNAPFLGGSPYGLSGSLGLSNQDSLDAQGRPYHEVFESAALGGSYALSAQHPSAGWSLGAGLDWQRDSPSGAFAPRSASYALGPAFSATYNDLRYLIYSEQGQRLRVSTQYSLDGLAANYSSASGSVAWRRDWQVGATPHQTLELLGSGGLYLGGAPGRTHDFYTLGGQRTLRGYPSTFVEGDTGYYLAGAYLRPVGPSWLRLLATVEAGNAFADLHHLHGPAAYSSIALGLRVRVNWLVNLELEAGAALPLDRARGVRLFAGSVDQGR